MLRTPAEDLCTTTADGWVSTPTCWLDLVESVGLDILASEELGGTYSGDGAVVVTDRTGQVGWYAYSWGSCPACDILESLETVEDVAELQQDIATGVVWFDTPAHFADWARSRDWKLQPADLGDFAASTGDTIGALTPTAMPLVAWLLAAAAAKRTDQTPRPEHLTAAVDAVRSYAAHRA